MARSLTTFCSMDRFDTTPAPGWRHFLVGLPGFPSRPARYSVRAAVAVLTVLVWPVLGSSLAAGSGPAAFTSHLLAPDPEWQATRGARAATGPGLAAAVGNPAALASLSGGSAACSHLQWAGGLTREWASSGWELDHGTALAVDAGILRGPELPGYNDQGDPVSSFRASEWNVGVHGARMLGRGLSAGVGARLFRLEDEVEPLTGAGLSFGMRMRGATRVVGLALTDVGAPLRGRQGAYTLPTRWRAGFEQELSDGGALAAISFEGDGSSGMRVAFGVVARPTASLELLGGLLAGGSGVEDSPVGWSAGTTVHHGALAVSYAFRSVDALGSTHLIGIRLGWLGSRRLGELATLPDPRNSDPAPAYQQAPPVESGMSAPGQAVYGGRYRTAEAAGAEAALLRTKGMPAARIVGEGDGHWRVLALECRTPEDAAGAVSRLRGWTILATAEPAFAPEPRVGNPDSP